MTLRDAVPPDTAQETATLRERLGEAEDLIRALRHGEADALLVDGPAGEQVYTLQGAEHPYRVLVETMNEGAVTLLDDATILYCNVQFAELVRTPLAQTIGSSFARFVSASDGDAFAALFAVGVVGSSKGALTLAAGDGSSVPVQLSLRALRADAAAKVCVVITDMTEREQIETKIRASLREKELLLKEVHHRVKNNLQIVASMLRLQAHHVQDPRVTAVFRDSQNRIRAMALVHEQLYRSHDLTRIDAGAYLRSIASSVLGQYAVASQSITLTCEASPDVTLDIDVGIPLGLIVAELVSNSAKHAFPGDRPGAISVTLQVYDGSLLLVVEDNGIGYVPPPEPAPASLGHQLVQSLAHQLDGWLAFDGTSGMRIAFRMHWPASASMRV
jgi:two-component system, sensor histidine kinase PdtaS